MNVYQMEDLWIKFRVGRSAPTGSYEITRRGTRRAVTKYQEFYQTNAGLFTPDKWNELALSCVEETGSEELFNKIVEYCSSYCLWLKTNKDREEYALNILVGRIYRHWKDFSVTGLTENTAYIFEF